MFYNYIGLFLFSLDAAKVLPMCANFLHEHHNNIKKSAIFTNDAFKWYFNESYSLE